MVDLGAKSSQELLDGSPPTFQRSVELCKGLINFAFFCNRSRYVAMATHESRKIDVFREKNFDCTAILKRIGISE